MFKEYLNSYKYSIQGSNYANHLLVEEDEPKNERVLKE